MHPLPPPPHLPWQRPPPRARMTAVPSLSGTLPQWSPHRPSSPQLPGCSPPSLPVASTLSPKLSKAAHCTRSKGRSCSDLRAQPDTRPPPSCGPAPAPLDPLLFLSTGHSLLRPSPLQRQLWEDREFGRLCSPL